MCHVSVVWSGQFILMWNLNIHATISCCLQSKWCFNCRVIFVYEFFDRFIILYKKYMSNFHMMHACFINFSRLLIFLWLQLSLSCYLSLPSFFLVCSCLSMNGSFWWLCDIPILHIYMWLRVDKIVCSVFDCIVLLTNWMWKACHSRDVMIPIVTCDAVFHALKHNFACQCTK